MSFRSASGDAQYGDDSLRDGAGSSDNPFLGDLPHPQSNGESHEDIIPRDTPSRIILPTVDEKQIASRTTSIDRVGIESQTQHRHKQSTLKPKSMPARIPRKKQVDSTSDEKPHTGAMDLEDRKLLDVELSEGDEHDSDDALTIFDAVAGRLGYEGLIKGSQQPVSAADYLFRYQRGPQQDQNYEEFSAHRHLEHRLPDSDLLKAIHAHASDFYGAMPDAKDSFESMDETALIAMGILLEEFATERLGATGDLAFVEAARPEEVDYPPPDDRKVKRQKIKHEGEVKTERGIKAEFGSSDEMSSVDDRGRSSCQERRRGAQMEESDVATGDESEHPEEDPSHNSEVESWISQTMLDSHGEPTDLPIR